MRGYAFLLATAVTLGYGFAAQAAMSTNRSNTLRRVAGDSAAAVPADVDRVYYGGTLAPVTVEVQGDVVRTRTARKALLGRCVVV